MLASTIFQRSSVTVDDYRCSATPADAPFAELHGDYSVSYVRSGSFGYRYRGETYELVAGSVLIGHPGDEYTCTHEHHHGGDECLSFHLSPELVESIGGAAEAQAAYGARAGCHRSRSSSFSASSRRR